VGDDVAGVPVDDRTGKRGHGGCDVLMDTRIARRDLDVAVGHMTV